MPAQQVTTAEVRNCILDAVLSFVDLGRGGVPPGQASQARWPCAEHIPGHAPVNSGHAVGDHAAGRDSAATHDAAYRPTRRYPDATDDAAHHGADPPNHPDETGHAAVHYNHDAARPDDPLSPVIRMQHSHVHRFPEGIPLLVVVGDADGRAIRRRRTESGDEPHRIDREWRRTESGDSGWGEGDSRWNEGGLVANYVPDGGSGGCDRAKQGHTAGTTLSSGDSGRGYGPGGGSGRARADQGQGRTGGTVLYAGKGHRLGYAQRPTEESRGEAPSTPPRAAQPRGGTAGSVFRPFPSPPTSAVDLDRSVRSTGCGLAISERSYAEHAETCTNPQECTLPPLVFQQSPSDAAPAESTRSENAPPGHAHVESERFAPGDCIEPKSSIQAAKASPPIPSGTTERDSPGNKRRPQINPAAPPPKVGRVELVDLPNCGRDQTDAILDLWPQAYGPWPKLGPVDPSPFVDVPAFPKSGAMPDRTGDAESESEESESDQTGDSDGDSARNDIIFETTTIGRFREIPHDEPGGEWAHIGGKKRYGRWLPGPMPASPSPDREAALVALSPRTEPMPSTTPSPTTLAALLPVVSSTPSTPASVTWIPRVSMAMEQRHRATAMEQQAQEPAP